MFCVATTYLATEIIQVSLFILMVFYGLPQFLIHSLHLCAYILLSPKVHLECFFFFHENHLYLKEESFGFMIFLWHFNISHEFLNFVRVEMLLFLIRPQRVTLVVRLLCVFNSLLLGSGLRRVSLSFVHFTV